MKTEPSGAAQNFFKCDEQGYVRHWAVVGPERTPYKGKSGSDDFMRRESVDQTIVEPPRQVALGAPGPFNQPWRFYYPGENIFVECTAFYHLLEKLDYYAATDLQAPRDLTAEAKFWAVGTADLWVNGAHICRHDVPRYMRPDSQKIALPLRKGSNRLYVRLQGLGVRDTRMLFGLQLLTGANEVSIQLPAPPETTVRLVEAEQWLHGVKPESKGALVSALPAPSGATVKLGRESQASPWPAGKTRYEVNPAQAFQITLQMNVAGQMFGRPLEIPANRPSSSAPGGSIEEHRRKYVEHISAESKGNDAIALLARRTAGQKRDTDAKTLADTIQGIESRRDCSDFYLAALLRMRAMGMTSPEESEQIKRLALGFRYWSDEPGSDAMCFGSENHALLFYGCQLMAGRMFANETFTNSKRKGSEQAAIAAKRCLDWLSRRERVGFDEFLSSTYMPITMAAVMNLVDFSGDAAMSKRAAALADRIFNDLALQAFDGVTVGPQGRVYRNVLYPQDSGTQALLSYASAEAQPSWSNWVAFVSSSQNYVPPRGLDEIMRQPAAKTYRQADVEITANKTPAYFLTSLQIPASFSNAGAAGGKRVGLQPGGAGYQQHLWHATLGRDCHVFVNHPGASFDKSESRPGYWYGNGVIPRLSQRGDTLMEIFDIPESHPIPFTHAHWPSNAFDRQEIRGQWAFGMKGDGCIALWCSQPLQPFSDIMTGRELRAMGRRAAWVCVCGSAKESGGFEAFIKKCLTAEPAFAAEKLALKWSGAEALRGEPTIAASAKEKK
ncbi:MAG: hypothetical protein NTX50_07455 [Candidatus Sumerlaeota bacterium]|nr:hypothetical protein [Candidatus Sumerlaeota bacterium]